LAGGAKGLERDRLTFWLPDQQDFRRRTRAGGRSADFAGVEITWHSLYDTLCMGNIFNHFKMM
jgi:hypothetical protein